LGVEDVDRLPSVLGYDSERTQIQNCGEHNINSSDNESHPVLNTNTNDCNQEKDTTKLDTLKEGEDTDLKRTKPDPNEESVETDEVVTYTDSSTFLKVSFN